MKCREKQDIFIVDSTVIGIIDRILILCQIALVVPLFITKNLKCKVTFCITYTLQTLLFTEKFHKIVKILPLLETAVEFSLH